MFTAFLLCSSSLIQDLTKWFFSEKINKILDVTVKVNDSEAIKSNDAMWYKFHFGSRKF